MNDTRLQGYEVAGVVAGAYRGGMRELLTHYEVPGTNNALCGRVKPGCLADVYEEPTDLPTCKSCLAKARKLQR